MAIAVESTPSLETLLRLGRISNLPTVVSNVVAATILAGAGPQPGRTGAVVLAMALFYLGGMYLNDYFDRAADARERPARPIPAGEIAPGRVATIGFAMLAAAMALMLWMGPAAAIAGLVLALVIMFYDVFHTHNPAAPIVMGLCRALVYCGTAAAAAGTLSAALLAAAAAQFAYVAGLTCAARQESLDRVDTLWPLLVLAVPLLVALPALGQGIVAIVIYLVLLASVGHAVRLLAKRPSPGAVPRAVGSLIAGISLVDAALLAGAGAIVPALAAAACSAATRLLQRYVAGT